MAAVKPVILLAFANDPADGINYLRNLPEEARRLTAALETAAAQGLCEFEVRYNATLDDILGAFQQPKLRGRIAVFHYGGHADSYELLFQSSPGSLQRVDGRGFAAFLAEQQGLQLVFLNACTTEPQVDGLLEANVQVVIATTREVDDSVAAELAGRFYAELARGASIGSAYRQAVAALRAAKGDDPALFYTPGGGPPPAAEDTPAAAENIPAAENTPAAAPPAPPPATVEAGGGASGGYWPWLLRTRRGAEGAVEWSLPQAAGDPLFGLPPLPPKPLPPSPYQRALDYYTRDLAELFFGRGRQIRDLHQRVTAPGRSAVILYYGQSGVGKSSLLDAGLAPRLAATHAVIYARRDRSLGLLGTLQKQLAGCSTETQAQAQQGAPASPTAPASDPAPLLTSWLAAEQQAGKPLVLILDQVEELFSRRNPDQPHELEEFAGALGALATAPVKPAGVLLLGFRKERLAEIEAALTTQRVDFAKLFLEPLDVTGIQEVFWGPVRNERLHAKYALSVEDDLPALVAHDLTADPDSPVAPTLNILLRKLWAAATQQSASAPAFSSALYEHLRRDGILLDDFLRQQTATLAQEQPDAVTSGLLLDLWAFHTTALGTSDQRDAAELQAAYGPRPGVEALILRSKELYVLADPAGDSSAAAAVNGTRLAHDTLAPLVRRDFGDSALPGQQARRLLESRAVDWEAGRSGPLLDDPALAVIDKGLEGMRALTEAEQRLLSASRAAQAERVRRRRLTRGAAAAAALLVLALLALTFFAWDSGRLQSERADREAAERIAAEERADRETAERQVAQERADREAAERAAAEERSRATQLSNQFANERQRAAESQRIAQLAGQQLAADPVTALHLALAANAVPPAISEAEYALRQAVLTSRERTFITATVTLPDQVAQRADRLAVGGPTPAVYDLELNPQPFALPRPFTDIVGLRWASDLRLLGWNSRSLWVVGAGAPQQFPVTLAEDDQVRCAEWQPLGRWVAICTYNNLYAWQPDSGRVVTVTTELDTPALATEPRSAAWSPDGRWLAGLGAKLALWDSSAPAAAAQLFYPPAQPGRYVALDAWLPDASLLVAWSPLSGAGPQPFLWSAQAADLAEVTLPPSASRAADANLLYAPDPQTGAPGLLHWSRTGLLARYDLVGNETGRAGDVPLNLRQPLLSPNGEHVAGFSADGTAVIWSLPDLAVAARLNRTDRFVAGSLTSAAWLDNQTLVLGDNSGLLQVAALDYATGGVAVTRLAGAAPGERLAQALRLADGRLLTAGLSDNPGGAGLRIWQLDPLPLDPGEELPTASAPLSQRLHRSLPLPPDLPTAVLHRWDAPAVLTLGDTEQVARWPLGGEAQTLPVDEELYQYALAPDGGQLLRYGDGTDGQIWRLSPTGWRRGTTLRGPIAAAVWSPHGLLVDYTTGGSALVDPAGGDARPLPPALHAGGSTMLTADLLLGAGRGEILLWDLASDQQVAAQTVAGAGELSLDAAAADGRTFVWRSAFGNLYALGVDAGQGALNELWRSTGASLNRPPSALHPTQPLLATVDGGSATIVNLAQGVIAWQSASAAAVAGQNFLTVQWSTDGQYLITQAEAPPPSTFAISIGVWRWDATQQRPILLQEMPAAALLAVSPDAQTVLALPPGDLPPQVVWIYPVLADAAQLRRDVLAPCQDAQAACLLTRPLAAGQRQAFGLQGR